MVGSEVNHYEIESEIGRGGMGVVYKARDTKLGRTVALKFLPASHHANDDAEARFIHEAKSISALDHPNVAVVHEIGQTDRGQLYIVMGYYIGETLADIIARGPLDCDEAVDYAKQIASGLQCAHENGITHRDVKPGNMIVTKSGLLKILDFGLAKVRDITMTADNLSVGTPAYISPEQSTGMPFDHRVDLWALGVVMYEMLAGKRPFVGEYPSAVAYGIVNQQPPDLRDIRSDVPAEVLEIVDRLLKKNPDERYAAASDVVTALSYDDKTAIVHSVEVPDESELSERESFTSLLSRDSITRTVTEVVPKKVFGFAARLFYSVAVSLIAVVIGYFFQDYFFSKKAAPEPVQEITEEIRLEARQHLEAGIKHLQENNLSLALVELERSIAKDPTYSPAWSTKSAAYLQQQNYEAAIVAATEAINLDPSNQTAFYNLGYALSSQGSAEASRGNIAAANEKYDAAIEAFEDATKVNPGFTRAYSAWGDLLIERGKPADALVVLTKEDAVAEPLYKFLIYKNTGKAHMRLSQYSLAIDFLESSKAERTDWPETNWLLAQCYEEEGRLDEARDLYEYYLSIEQNPELKNRAREHLTEISG